MRRNDLPPVRVARVIARLNVGGPARHVVWLSESLAGPDFQTMLITGTVPEGEADMTGFATAHGVQPVVVAEMSREISARDVITVWKLYHHFRRFRPDIIHTHTAKAGTVGRVAGLMYQLTTRRRIRFVHTFHGHVFHSYYGRWKTKLFITIEKVLARLTTDIIITISEQQRREIHETFGIGRSDQFRVVPLGLDLTEFQALSKPQNPAVVVGIVGRIAPIKNHDLFLRLVASRPWPPSVRFVVYGDGAGRAALEERALALGVADRVTFAGTRPPKEIYASIDIALLTSLNEGTPLTIIEAMAAGIPAISTAVGGVVDVLGVTRERVTQDGAVYEIRERGMTAASDDERGLAGALQRLLDDPTLREDLGARGRSYSHVAYSKERLVADIISVYRQLGARFR